MYHAHNICVLWDKSGERYKRGMGFKVYCDEKEVYSSDIPEKAEIDLMLMER